MGGGRATERTSFPACGEAKNVSSARTTASIAFGCPPLPCLGGGELPSASLLRAEAHTHFMMEVFH
ncbi:MAG: hypothetical protein IKC03_06485 [Oscillospiraceae bacterium]|nr:hypothetical protein [Oscillospiraceae bacterium]